MANTNGKLVITKKGGPELVFGAVLMLLPLVLLPYRPVSVTGNVIADYVVRFVLMAVFIVGFRLLADGSRKRKLYQKLLRLQGLFDDSHRTPLSMAASLLGCSLSRLVSDVRAMQKLGLIEGFYADLLRGDLVYTGDAAVIFSPPPEESVQPALREKHRKSALPFYMFALVWATYALFFPFYRTIDLAAALILSLVAFFHTAWSAPPRILIFEVPPVIPTPMQTGNEALDEMLRGIEGHMNTLRRLEYSLEGKVALHTRDILRTTEQIVEQVKKHPEKTSEMRQFFNYTLPTTINLLQNYEELRAQPVQGQNISATIAKIEDMMCSIVEAFHRQHDALFADKALNIAVEIDVMSKMLNTGGGMKEMHSDFSQNK